ncbi:MAG TPA: metabolite traffic protein EboE [Kofleriaceae bacterium]|nr:metabolite traffic protein EboE [Kofleriaceae bacterium]
MRCALSDGRTVDLGYCYNVLPGESAAALALQARRICGPVRARLGVERMGVGLWIARAAATELVSDPAARRALAAALREQGLYVYTLNGFPYGGFHAPRVKHAVFEPSWAAPERVDYTLDLATLLAELLPDELGGGSISTVPLGPSTVDRARAADGLRRCADGLAALAARTGRTIDVGLEPEPGAGFERVDALAAYLAAARTGPRIGACLDCCHAAVVDEAPAAAFAALDAAGVTCSKIQLSSALVVPRPADDAQRAALAGFDEPRFLHQVRSARGGAMDLPDALATLDRGVPWRVHFHVPVHDADAGILSTTRDAIAPVLAAALARPGPLPQLEVETYTWSVLPAARRPTDDAGLVDGIARELAWARELVATIAPSALSTPIAPNAPAGAHR